jgi:hypothetical protein
LAIEGSYHHNATKENPVSTEGQGKGKEAWTIALASRCLISFITTTRSPSTSQSHRKYAKHYYISEHRYF